MFIRIMYKDPSDLFGDKEKLPVVEHSTISVTSSKMIKSINHDISSKILLANPDCHAILLREHIRTKCKLKSDTYFDVCDEHGFLKHLFLKQPHENMREFFHNKKLYYLIVMKNDPSERHNAVLPQMSRHNKLYAELKAKVTRFIETGDMTMTVSSSDSELKGKKKKRNHKL